MSISRLPATAQATKSRPGQVVSSTFSPAWWLRSPHLQTLWPAVLRRGPGLAMHRERLELADGDFLDLDWTSRADGPIVVLLSGLEGSSRSHYMSGLLDALDRAGWRAVVMNFRGCSGSLNRLSRTYHSGDTGDLNTVIDLLKARAPSAPLAVVGFSLGGNVVLKWLGERGFESPIAAAVAVSVPMRLELCAARLERGFSRLYQWWLLSDLRRKMRAKFSDLAPPIDLSALASWRTFYTFDENVTAPLHGFSGAEDYYRCASSRPFLKHIRRPTLIVHALDDPFMPKEVLPEASELSPSVLLELSEHGGHVGFVEAGRLGRARYWLDDRIPDFLGEHLSS